MCIKSCHGADYAIKTARIQGIRAGLEPCETRAKHPSVLGEVTAKLLAFRPQNFRRFFPTYAPMPGETSPRKRAGIRASLLYLLKRVGRGYQRGIFGLIFRRDDALVAELREKHPRSVYEEHIAIGNATANLCAYVALCKVAHGNFGIINPAYTRIRFSTSSADTR